MSDRIAVMNRGRVEQVGEAARVFERPATEFVANFMGASNFFAGSAVEASGGDVVARALAEAGGRASPLDGAPAPRAGEAVRFVVRPEKLDLRRRDLSDTGRALRRRDRGGPRLPGHLDDLVGARRGGRALHGLRAERAPVRGVLALAGRRAALPVLPRARRGAPPSGRRRSRVSGDSGGGARPGRLPADPPDVGGPRRLLPAAAVRALRHQLRAARDVRRAAADRGPRRLRPLGEVPRRTTRARSHPIYLQIFWRSVWMAVVTTVLCLLVSYPVAYYVAIVAPPRRRNLLLGPGRRPVLDELPDPHLRVDVHPADRGPREPAPDGRRPDVAPARAALQRLRRADRPGLRRAAVHDPAALRLAREARPLAARGVGRPRRARARDVPARDGPADDARHRGGRRARLRARASASSSSRTCSAARRRSSPATSSRTSSPSRATSRSARPSPSS